MTSQAIRDPLADHLITPQNAALLLIDYQPAEVTWLCSAPQIIAHLTVPYNVKGLEQGAPVTFCQLKAPIPTIWGRLRKFS